jgi:hypothetical protein
MIASEVSRLQPNDEMRVLGNVGPVLTGVVDGSEVSLVTARWERGVDEEGATTTPHVSSLFVAVRVPERLPTVTVRHRPSAPAPAAGGLFASLRTFQERAGARNELYTREWRHLPGCHVTS